jgi:hypothetical protein
MQGSLPCHQGDCSSYEGGWARPPNHPSSLLSLWEILNKVFYSLVKVFGSHSQG